MKKQLYSVLFLMSGFGVMHAAELAKNPGYAKIKHEVDLVREKVYRRAVGDAAKGATVGATLGAGYMTLAGEERRQQWFNKPDIPSKYYYYAMSSAGGATIGATGGALAGAIVGAGKSELQRRYIIWRINAALHPTAYDFMKMPINEAVMVMAAYKRDLLVMQTVMPQVQRFLKKRGVWQALAQLYFGASTPEHVSRLKEALETE